MKLNSFLVSMQYYQRTRNYQAYDRTKQEFLGYMEGANVNRDVRLLFKVIERIGNRAGYRELTDNILNRIYYTAIEDYEQAAGLSGAIDKGVRALFAPERV